MIKMGIAVMMLLMAGCNSNGVNTTTRTQTDAITNITNPGVGAASDDTTIKD